MVAVDEDFFLLVRVDRQPHPGPALGRHRRRGVGPGHLRGRAPRERSDSRSRTTRTTPSPAGHLDLLGDLGVPEAELSELLDEMLDDDELYPDEMLSDLARLLGFGEEFDDVVGLTSA